MPTRSSKASWKDSLKDGSGSMKFGSGAYEGAFTFASRFEDGKGTNPEELIGAAHAGCYSMALTGDLNDAGYENTEVNTQADVHLDMSGDAPTIKRIVLNTEASVPGVSEDEFLEIAKGAKDNCPVSRALDGVNIELKAKLK